MTVYRLDLPAGEVLTANQRMHWAPKARLVKKLRTAAAWTARAAIPTGWQHVEVRMHYRPATNRRRDADNLAPTLKALCDGLVDAGLVPDDTPQYMTKYMPELHAHSKGEPAALWLEITTPEKDTPA